MEKAPVKRMASTRKNCNNNKLFHIAKPRSPYKNSLKSKYRKTSCKKALLAVSLIITMNLSTRQEKEKTGTHVPLLAYDCSTKKDPNSNL